MMSVTKKVIFSDEEGVFLEKRVALRSTIDQDFIDEAWRIAIEDNQVEDVYRDNFTFDVVPDDSFI
jgi:hypothetical protein